MKACCIYAMKQFPHETAKQLYTPTFPNEHQAKRWLDIVMGDENATRVGAELRLESGITIRSFELDRILDYQYKSGEEQRWLPSQDELVMIARFRRGIWFPEPSETEAAIKASPDIISTKSKAKLNVSTADKVVMPAGYVKVVDLVKGTSVRPMDARAILRSTMSKPAYGWAFAPERLPEIRKLIGV